MRRREFITLLGGRRPHGHWAPLRRAPEDDGALDGQTMLGPSHLQWANVHSSNDT